MRARAVFRKARVPGPRVQQCGADGRARARLKSAGEVRTIVRLRRDRAGYWEHRVHRAPSILYCHCAYAEVLAPDVKRGVLAGLARSGARFEAVADLCELAATRDPSLAKFAATAGPVHIIACHERAVRWLFAAAGAPLPASATVHNMRTQDAAAILASAGVDTERPRAKQRALAGKPPVAPAALPSFAAKGDGDWVPWFPVIDYDRCKACRQCVEFCLFGTYAVDDGGTVRVVRPEKCKTNCPACARVCPHSAIIFPKFADGPISGDEGRLAGAFESGVAADMAGLSKSDVMALLKRRNAAQARATAAGDASSGTGGKESSAR